MALRKKIRPADFTAALCLLRVGHFDERLLSRVTGLRSAYAANVLDRLVRRGLAGPTPSGVALTARAFAGRADVRACEKLGLDRPYEPTVSEVALAHGRALKGRRGALPSGMGAAFSEGLESRGFSALPSWKRR